MFLDFRFLFFQKPKKEISLFLSHYGHPAAAAAVNLKQIYLPFDRFGPSTYILPTQTICKVASWFTVFSNETI